MDAEMKKIRVDGLFLPFALTFYTAVLITYCFIPCRYVLYPFCFIMACCIVMYCYILHICIIAAMTIITITLTTPLFIVTCGFMVYYMCYCIMVYYTGTIASIYMIPSMAPITLACKVSSMFIPFFI